MAALLFVVPSLNGVSAVRADAASLHAPTALMANQTALATTADGCGFEHRVWGHIQAAADALNLVTKKTNDQGGKINYADMTFYKVYLRDSVRDMAHDYGNPPGWQNLMQALTDEMNQLHAALSDYDENGPNGGVSAFHTIKYPTYVSNASVMQSKVWAMTKAFCPNGGQSRTYTGLQNLYASGDLDAPWITVPAKWAVIYHYDCAGLRDYSDGQGGNGYFHLTLRSAGNNLVAEGADEQGKTAWGTQHFTRAGRFYLKVQSDCYWHIKVVPSR